MTHSLFVSDLHLCRERPLTTRLFLDFLFHQAPDAESLFILGDLFEYWAGDDDIDDTHHAQVVTALRSASARGCRLYVMHGNRDFLMGTDFAGASGAELLPDPLLIDLYGRQTLLTHGDTLCTDDTDYQRFRTMVRAPQWQSNFLSMPLNERKTQIEKLRSRSKQEKSWKDEAIMDVNETAVMEMLRQHGYPPTLIHGHTHRPARHPLEVDGRSCERIVLTDWNDRGGYVKCDATGCEVVEVG